MLAGDKVAKLVSKGQYGIPLIAKCMPTTPLFLPPGNTNSGAVT